VQETPCRTLIWEKLGVGSIVQVVPSQCSATVKSSPWLWLTYQPMAVHDVAEGHATAMRWFRTKSGLGVG
jgi:hypothetical protein